MNDAPHSLRNNSVRGDARCISRSRCFQLLEWHFIGQQAVDVGVRQFFFWLITRVPIGIRHKWMRMQRSPSQQLTFQFQIFRKLAIVRHQLGIVLDCRCNDDSVLRISMMFMQFKHPAKWRSPLSNCSVNAAFRQWCDRWNVAPAGNCLVLAQSLPCAKPLSRDPRERS